MMVGCEMMSTYIEEVWSFGLVMMWVYALLNPAWWCPVQLCSFTSSSEGHIVLGTLVVYVVKGRGLGCEIWLV